MNKIEAPRAAVYKQMRIYKLPTVASDVCNAREWYAPSCSEARGGVISLDPPPPDTTAEPGGNQIALDSHPLGMIPRVRCYLIFFFRRKCVV